MCVKFQGSKSTQSEHATPLYHGHALPSSPCCAVLTSLATLHFTALQRQSIHHSHGQVHFWPDLKQLSSHKTKLIILFATLIFPASFCPPFQTIRLLFQIVLPIRTLRFQTNDLCTIKFFQYIRLQFNFSPCHSFINFYSYYVVFWCYPSPKTDFSITETQCLKELGRLKWTY